jgi:hypothetical protein
MASQGYKTTGKDEGDVKPTAVGFLYERYKALYFYILYCSISFLNDIL